MLFAILIALSCRKADIAGSDSHNVEIYEYGTGRPVGGVTINLFKCGYFDYLYGCTQNALLASYSTNNEGVARVSGEHYLQATRGMEALKSGYWTQEVGKGRNEICPEARIRINMNCANNYPPGKWLYIANVEERLLLTNNLGTYVYSSNRLVDTTVEVRAFGNQNNRLRWMVADHGGYIVHHSGSLAPVHVAGGNTVTVNLSY